MWDSQLSASSVSCLTGLRWNASLTRCTLSSEGPGRPGYFAMHRHPSCWNFSYHCLILFLTGESFTNFVRKLRCTATIDCVHAHAKSLLCSRRCNLSLNLLPWRPPTKQSARGTYKQTWRLSLSMCESHVEVLSAIQVYRFCEMCQGIMNNPVYIHLILPYFITLMTCGEKY